MICNTKTQSEDGTQGWKYKKAYDTLDLAIAEAKKQNALDKQTIKLVAYKCTYCFKYHIGRNGKPIKAKDKEKLKAELLANQKPMRVIGWIDLDKIKY